MFNPYKFNAFEIFKLTCTSVVKIKIFQNMYGIPVMPDLPGKEFLIPATVTFGIKKSNSVRERRFQHTFTVNVWVGMDGNFLTGPYFFPNKLNEDIYKRFWKKCWMNCWKIYR